MFKGFFILCLSVLLLNSCDCSAGTSTVPLVKKQFMPDNNLHLQDKNQRPNITEDEFNSILDVIEQVYAPIFKKFGATFNLERDWEDSTVNAWADQAGSVWTVHMYGGMARRSEMNIAGFGLVACHEIGHHLAGVPRWSDSPWAANEGNSDYFANHVCAYKVFDALPLPSDLSPFGVKKCDEAWQDQLSRERCYKALSGGQALGNLLGTLGGTGNPNFETPDPTVVTKTKDEHPKAQCRLDTYLAGSVCTLAWDDAVIPKVENVVCDNRPRCWYKKQGDEPNPPNPDDKADYDTMNLINKVRGKYGLKAMSENELLTCASYIHASDIGPADWCSHIGTDNSSFTQRVRSCGYKYSAVELLTCRRPTPEAAVNRWMQDSASKRNILSRQWSGFGCSSNNNFYVCVLGYK